MDFESTYGQNVGNYIRLEQYSDARVAFARGCRSSNFGTTGFWIFFSKEMHVSRGKEFFEKSILTQTLHHGFLLCNIVDKQSCCRFEEKLLRSRLSGRLFKQDGSRSLPIARVKKNGRFAVRLTGNRWQALEPCWRMRATKYTTSGVSNPPPNSTRVQPRYRKIKIFSILFIRLFVIVLYFNHHPRFLERKQKKFPCGENDFRDQPNMAEPIASANLAFVGIFPGTHARDARRPASGQQVRS